MTIETYFFTFGFLIKIEDCLKVLGFTPDKLTDELRKQIEENAMNDLNTDEDYCMEWFQNGSFVIAHTFKINHQEYIVRSFAHDNVEYHDKYYVVGINCREIDRWSGKCEETTSGDVRELMKPLANSPEWIKAIQNCKLQTKLYRREDYAVEDPDYPKFSYSPSIYITTDDCDCCS